MISPTCPRWTPSGLTARKVLSYTITIESNNLHEASDSIYFYLWSCHRGGVTGIPAFLHIHHLFINLVVAGGHSHSGAEVTQLVVDLDVLLQVGLLQQ